MTVNRFSSSSAFYSVMETSVPTFILLFLFASAGLSLGEAYYLWLLHSTVVHSTFILSCDV